MFWFCEELLRYIRWKHDFVIVFIKFSRAKRGINGCQPDRVWTMIDLYSFNLVKLELHFQESP